MGALPILYSYAMVESDIIARRNPPWDSTI